MKLSKTQRRVASKMILPFIAFLSMTTMMALSGATTSQDTSAHVSMP